MDTKPSEEKTPGVSKNYPAGASIRFAILPFSGSNFFKTPGVLTEV